MSDEEALPPEVQGGALYRALLVLFAPFLGRHSFECVSYKYDPEGAGRELIEFVSGDTRLRLINDRDRFFADLGQEQGATWFATNDLFELLGVAQSEIDAGIADPAALAKLLTAQFGAMLRLVSPALVAMTQDSVLVLKQRRMDKAQNGVQSRTLH